MMKIHEKKEVTLLDEIVKEELEEQKQLELAKIEKNSAEESKQKVYGAPSRPNARNIREREYEQESSEAIDWVPPETRINDRNERLKRKLGY